LHDVLSIVADVSQTISGWQSNRLTGVNRRSRIGGNAPLTRIKGAPTRNLLFVFRACVRG